ncbi:MAG: FHA domain-containing protein [Planctomycetaceae bacterium]|nr:MAG: FHA domain-containing protein [Planctomycetaceae bacterium]
MVTYLLVRSGPDLGRQFPLDPSRPLHVGRGDSCEIKLTDPISSRFHAVIYFEGEHWQLRDTGSRNGTLVNNQRTDHAMLIDQTLIQVGGTELQLVEVPADEGPPANTATIILDRPIDSPLDLANHFQALEALRSNAFVGRLLDLYQLSINLLRSHRVGDVYQLAIELLQKRTDADVVGFSVDAGNGRLTPQRFVPESGAGTMKVGQRIARRVLREGEAVWFSVSEESADVDNAWSDAIWVPLTNGEQVVGVLQLYHCHARFKPDDFELAAAIGRLLGAAIDRAQQTGNLEAAHRRFADRHADSGAIVGESAPIRRLKEKIVRIGGAQGSVLIRGESGVGKELVARALHQASSRRDRPMLAVNCAAISRDLVESQLFGHKKGSFTGADADHTGWFQQAHTGTLFLDEVGELTMEAQAKLLRILEGHPFLPVGGTQQILVDVRVIAATNRDLAEFVRERRFREDLFYRLSVFELLVPPLRDREEDLDRLIDHFFEHFRVEHHRTGLSLSETARERLRRYPWPGNVRQLRNVIDSAVVMADGPEIVPADLALHDASADEMESLRIDHWERRLITLALDRTDGNVPEAAELLGISRATAYRKIAEYGIQK